MDKAKDELKTIQKFADDHEVNYRTVLNWVDKGWIDCIKKVKGTRLVKYIYESEYEKIKKRIK